MNPKKIYLAVGGAAGGSHWWELQPVRRENGAVDGGVAEKRILSRLLISGKNWVSKVKKTSLTKMAC